MRLLRQLLGWLGTRTLRAPAAARAPAHAPAPTLRVEELERRILYSAELNPLLAAGLAPDAGAPAQVQWLSGASAAAAEPGATTLVQGQLAQAPPAADPPAPSAARRHELLFVDAGVADAQRLVDAVLAARDAGTEIEVVQISAGADGLDQISAVLAGEQALDAVHIVSHGAAGQLQLGQGLVDAATLQARAGQLAGWASALTADADLLLWGCDVAQGAQGQAFVQQLARLTGADMAASTDTTGAAAQGGNWQLEFRSGAVDAAVDSTLLALAGSTFSGTLATNNFVVSSLADSGAGTLRQAITSANASGVADLNNISFSVSGSILLSTALPTLVRQVAIDASSGGVPAVALVDNTSVARGLDFGAGADGSSVRGLSIQGFDNEGIRISGANGVSVLGNHIGTNLAGTAAAGNNTGVYVIAANNTVIGSSAAADRNVISGNSGTGVALSSGSDGTVVQGNRIGTNATGTAAIANFEGMALYNTTNTTVGGAGAGQGNLISGNSNINLLINGSLASSANSGSTVLGNTIGTDLAGNSDISAAWHGILVNNSANLSIGGSSAGAGNLVSGHGDKGLFLDANTHQVTVAGNRIGTNAAGTAAIANNTGLAVEGYQNTIGGSAAGAGNLVSGNTTLGIELGTATATGNTVAGNLVGVDLSGSTRLGNGRDGISLNAGAHDNTIGGSTSGAANTVAGNNTVAGTANINITGAGSSGNLVQGNRVGVNLSGALLANGKPGIYLDSGAHDNLIGGTTLVAANDVGGNFQYGIVIDGAGTVNNAVLINRLHDHSTLGLDLVGGGNNSQVAPTLTSVTTTTAGTTVGVNLSGTNGVTYRVDVYANRNSSADGTPEADRWLGAFNHSFTSTGVESFSASFSDAWANHGDQVKATATVVTGSGLGYGNTSELSAATNANTTGVVVVDTTSDLSDGTTTSISNLGNSRGADGRISLREALTTLNASANGANPDKLVFAIPGSGVHTITPLTALPSITDAVTLDASTDDSFAANANRPAIILDGNDLAASGLALSATADGSTVKGLVVRDFNGVGISIAAGADGNTIVGNYVGALDATGAHAAGEENTTGIDVQGANNTVGGTTALLRNVISGNSYSGVALVNASATGNVVIGNYVGVQADGITAVADTGVGVASWNGASNNRIGGTAAGEGNTIANRIGGVMLDANTAPVFSTAILGNAIYGNTNLGIDLGWFNGVNANDPGDGDSGINNGQNFPVLAAARTNASNQLTLTGSLNSSASSHYRIEFFANTSPDATGYGEGQTYLGYTNVATNAAGDGAFAVTFAVAVPAGQAISATATRATDGTYSSFTDTSEFAANMLATAPVAPANTVPGAQTTNEDTARVFSTANGNAITVADSDAGGANNQVTLSVTNGTLTLATTAGLTFASGDGTADASMVVRGIAAAINTALDGLSFAPTANYDGGAVLTLATKDAVLLSLDIDTGLLGRYAFENAGNLGQDSSPAAGNAAATVGTTAVVDGTRGNVVQLDGSANSNLQITGRFGNPSNATLAAWVNVTAVDSSGAVVISLGDSLSLTFNATGQPRGFHYNGSAWTATTYNTSLTGTGWHHLAYTFSDSDNTTTLYLDGIAVSSQSTADSIGYSLGANSTIGTHANGAGTWDFNGRIDDARIFNRALTAAEVYALANDQAMTDSDTVAITVTAVNDAPVITLSGYSGTYVENASAIVDPGATVTDVDNTSFSGGILTYQVTANGSATDELAMVNQGSGAGQIGLAGSNVTYGGVTIGSFTGTGAGAFGNGSSPLVVSFNSNASTAAVQALLRNVSYRDTSNTPSTATRTLQLTLSDGSGGTSSPAVVTMAVTAVNDAPTDIAADVAVNDVAQNAITVIGAQTGSQTTSANLGNGRTVSVYVSAGEAYAQLYLDGQASGAAIRVLGQSDPDIGANVANPVVAAMPSGGFLVVLQADGYIEDGNWGTAIVGALFDDSGIRVDVQPAANGGLPVFLISGSTGAFSNNNTDQVNPTLDVNISAVVTVSWHNTSAGLFEQRAFSIPGPAVAESAAAGTIVATLRATDPEGDAVSFSIVGSNPDFEIVGNQILVKAGAALDFETTPLTTIVVRASDGSLSRDENFNITVSDANDAPVLTAAVGGGTHFENASTGTYFYNTLTLTDADAGDFNGGTLTTSVSANGETGDRLLVKDGAGVTTAGSDVLYDDGGGAVIIGSFVGGDGLNPLVISFNAASTAAGAQAVARQVAYRTDIDNPSGLQRTLQMVATDGAGGTSATATRSMNVMPVNDGPSFSALDGTPTLVENGAAVVLDSNLQVADAELSAADNFNGATLTLARNGGANAQDVFSATGTLSALTPGGNLVLGGTTIGTITTNAGGTLLLSFNASATHARVNLAMQQIAYSNSSDAPPASAQINWTFSDGNTGAQGSGGALTASGSTTVALAAVNDAPVLADTALSMTVLEDAGVPSGAVGSLVSAFTSGISDVDASPLKGLALVGSVETNGVWYYSTNSGTNWTAVGTVSAGSSLLLADNASTRLYFAPAANFSGSSAGALTVRGWDQTSGSAGTKVSTTSNGGSTAFSSATDVVDVTVNAVNDAPTLGNGSLAAVNEDPASPAGATVATIFSGQFADIDLGSSFSGIAVVGNTANAGTQGAWQYSSNGGTNWFDVGTVADGASALALSSTSLIRFVPVANFNGTPPALTVRGLDDTHMAGFSTTAGTETRVTVDTTTNGGTTAIAAATATLSTSISAVNDAPLNDLPGLQTTPVSTSLVLSAASAISVSDIDASVLQVGLTATHGVLSLAGLTGLTFSTGDGSGDTAMVFSGSTASVNAALDGLSFTPTAGYQGSASIDIVTSDLGASGSGGTRTDSDTLQIQVGAARFQEGVAGYAGTLDTHLLSGSPSTNFGAAVQVVADDNGAGEVALLKFDNLFGASAGMVPLGSTITSASLSIYVTATDAADSVALHRMLTAWTEASTYTSLGGGVQINDAEAAAGATATIDAGHGGWVTVNGLAATVQAWAMGAANHGWAFVSNNADGWAFASSEHATTSWRPYLTLSYTPPQGALLTTSAGSASHTENAAAVAVDPGLTLSDADSSQLVEAVVAITGGFRAGEDTLGFTNQSGITGSWNATTGVMTLSGTATVAQYQAALRSISYANGSEAPDTAGRTVSFTVSDAYVSSNTATRSMGVTAVNDAPVLDNSGTVPLSAQAEDAGAPVGAVGTAVTALVQLGGNVTDADATAQTGVAITAASTTNGSWWFTTDSGGTWQALGSVSDASARVLNADAATRVYFQPNAHFNGSLSGVLSFRAWDRSLGTNGSLQSASTSGGTSAFSAATEVADLTVTAVNDAPVASGSATLATINEDTAAPAGTTVSSLFSANFSDATDQVTGGSSANTLAGIAISSHTVDAAKGQWQYSTNSGSSWAALPSATLTTAFTLDSAASTMLRFVPAADYNGAATAISANLIESGLAITNGAAINLTSATGGTTPISTATVALDHSITAANDAPVLLDGLSGTLAEGTGDKLWAGQLATDVDSSDFDGGSLTFTITSGSDGREYMWFSGFGGVSNSGSDVLVSGVVIGTRTGGLAGAPLVLSFNANATLARVNSALEAMSLENNTDNPTVGARVITAVLTDGDGATSNTATATRSFTATNDAPGFSGLDGTPSVVEGGAAVVLDSDVQVSDPELTPADNFSGATLTLARNGGANAQDAFSASGTLGALTEGGSLVVGGSPVGSVTTNSGGTLVLAFNASATNARVNAVLQQIAYANGSDAPPASVQINWSFSDGNTGAQGSGGALSATGSTTVAISAANDAPVISGAATNATLTSIAENDIGNAGQTVASLIATMGAGAFTDPDGVSAPQGIAIHINNPNGAGTWQYSTNSGGTWADLGTVSATSALLLRDVDLLRMNPNGATGGSANVGFRAWDQSVGVAGNKVNAFTTGGSSAFSLLTRSALISVSSVNDAPVLATTGSALAYTENDAATPIDPGLTVSDLDNASFSGATVTISTNYSNGQDLLAFTNQLGITGSWNAGSGVLTLTGSATLADYQTALRSVSYANTSDAPSTLTRTVAFVVSDGTDNSNTASRSISVTAVNNAPVLADTGLTLAVAEDAGAPVGAVGALVGAFTGGISDPDGGPPGGLAITATDETHGSWYFSTDGGSSWLAVGAVSDSASLLLADDAGSRLYFAPVADFNGAATAALTLRAWDQSSGTAGSLAPTTSTGASTAFSVATDTVDVNVGPVNDAPVLSGPPITLTVIQDAGAPVGAVGRLLSALTGGISDIDAAALKGVALVAADESQGRWHYSTNGGASWQPVGALSSAASLLLADDGNTRLYFEPTPGYRGTSASTLTLRAWDQTSGVAGSQVSTAVTGGSSAFSSASTAVDARVIAPTQQSVASADSFSGSEDSTLSGDVLLNDTNSSSAVLLSGAAQGALVFNSDGSFSYQPGANWSGSDSFQYLANNPSSGLSHYWALEGSGDDAIGSAHGSLVNGPGVVAGHDGRALQLDGVDDHVLLPDVSYSNDFSLSFYFKVDDNTGDQLQYFYAHGAVGSNNLVYVALVESSNATAANRNKLVTTLLDANDNNSTQLFIDAAALIGDGQWHLYTATVDSGVGTRVYIDGALRGSVATGGDAINPVGNAVIGGRADLDPTRFLNAPNRIDSVALYNRALNGAEVASLASNALQAAVNLTVAPTNDAPTLANGATQALAGTDEMSASAGTTVGALLLAAGWADLDSGALQGVAITASTGNGSWQYSTDGTAPWTAVGSVSATSALLLDAGTWLRYLPDGQQGETASLGFKAWDQTSGTASANGTPSHASTSASGGGSAFSSGNAAASLAVSAVNNAPVATIGPVAYAATEQAPLVLKNTGLAIGDVDAGNAVMTVTLSVTEGTLTVTAGGSGALVANSGSGSVTLSGTVAQINALLGSDASSSLSYLNSSDTPSASATLTLAVSDNGNSGSGGALSASDTALIHIAALNDAPVATITPVAYAATEQLALVLKNTGLAIGDVDAGAGLMTATLTVTDGVLTATAGGSGALVANSGSAELTITGTVAQINALLGSDASSTLSYTATSDNPAASATLTLTVSDNGHSGGGGALAAAATATLAISALNDAPVIGVAATDATLTPISEDDINPAGQTVASLIAAMGAGAVTDPDGPAALQGIAVLSSSQPMGRWQYSVDGGSSWLDLGPVAASSALLLRDSDLVRLNPDGQSGGSASFDFRAWDQSSGVAGSRVDASSAGGGTAFSLATRSALVAVAPVNDAPVLATSGGALAYTENQPASAVDPGLSIADLDSATLAGASVRISANFMPGQDTLAFTDQNGISGSWDAATGVLTLTGSASVAQYQAALRSVGYANTSDNPDTALRSVAFSVSDGALDSNSGTRQVSMASTNDAPVLATSGGGLAYTEGDAGTPVDPGLALSDADSANLVGASVRISANFAPAEDLLAFTDQNGISGSWNAATGMLTLTGSASVAQYQAALRSVRYANTSDDPSTAPRSVAFVVSDGAQDSAVGTRQVTVAAANDAALLTTTATALPYTENDAATAVDPGLTISDPDSANLSGASIRLGGAFVPGEDTLAFTDQNGISGSWDAATGVLTLSGNASVASYQAALRSVGYANSADAPDTRSRLVEFVVSDGAANSHTATRSITVAALNDAPRTTPGVLITLVGTTEDQPSAGTTVADILAQAGWADPDAGALQGLAVTGSSGRGDWAYSTNGLLWTSFGPVAAGQALLLDAATLVRYTPDGLNGESAGFSFSAWDQTSGSPSRSGAPVSADPAPGGGSTAFGLQQGSVQLAVAAVNDAPTLAAGSAAVLPATEEDSSSAATPVAALLAAAGWADPDGGALQGIALTAATGSGQWQYSTDGLMWRSLGPVDSGHALLLDAGSWLRYQPDSANGETTSLAFVAWDQTGGSASTALAPAHADTSARGGRSAFSADTAAATLQVTPRNDAPTLAAGPAVVLVGTDEDTASAPTRVTDLLAAAGWADVDSGASQGIALTGSSGQGQWQYSRDGLGWTAVGATSPGSALLLDASSLLRYLPDTLNGESAGISFRAWDQTSGNASAPGMPVTADPGSGGAGSAYSSQTGQASLAVAARNDAPTLADNTTLAWAGTDEDTPTAGRPVAELLAAAQWADVDQAAIGGIAVVAASGNGSWQFSRDGNRWLDFGQPSAGTPLLLDAATLVRYAPDGRNGETAGFSFQAWDQSQGQAAATGAGAGASAGARPQAEGSARSAQIAQVVLQVSSLNDAPDVVAGAALDLASLTDNGAAIDVGQLLASALATDSDLGARQGLAVTGSTGSGSWQYSTDGQRWVAFGQVSPANALLLAAGTQLRYVPAAGVVETAGFDFKAWDQSAGQPSQADQAAYAATDASGGGGAFSRVQRVVTLRAGSASVADSPAAPAAPAAGTPGATATPDTPVADSAPTGAEAGAASARAAQPAATGDTTGQALANALRLASAGQAAEWQPLNRGEAKAAVGRDADGLPPANPWAVPVIDFNFDAAGGLATPDAGAGYGDSWLKRLLATGARQVEDSLVQLEIPGAAEARDDPASAVKMGVVGAAGITMTAGMLWWLTRGGGMLFSVLMGVPAWRHIDLLPIVAQRRDGPDDDELDDDDEADWSQRLRAAAGGDTLAPEDADAAAPGGAAPLTPVAAPAHAARNSLPTA